MKCLKPGMAAGVAVLTIIAGAPLAHAQPRVRQNIKDISSVDQQRFVDAMFALQGMAPAHAPGGNAALPQNRYEEYVRAHDRNTGLAHNNPFFLPWHRQFLFQMENDVRAMGAVTLPDGRAQNFSTFTLPYWDGTRDAYPSTLVGDVGPQPPDSLLGGNGNGAPNHRVTTGPFAANAVPAAGQWTAFNLTGNGLPVGNPDRVPFAATRDPLRREFQAVNPGANPPAGSFTMLTTGIMVPDPLPGNPGNMRMTAPGRTTLTNALALDGVTPGQTFTNFRQRLEHGDGLHDAHHVAVGGGNGQLGNPETGSVDPTFWLLHSFTDLQWARWECDRGALYQGGVNTGIDAAMSGDPDQVFSGRFGPPNPDGSPNPIFVSGGATFGLTELNGGTNAVAGTAVTPANVLNFLTMPGGGYTYDARLSYANETRTILGQGGHVCHVPAPGAFALLGLGGLLAARRRRDA